MKKNVLLFLLMCAVMGVQSCQSCGGDNNDTETQDLAENEIDADDTNVSEEGYYPNEEEESDFDYDESHYDNGGYHEVGTLGTMQLDYWGIEGDESNPRAYIGQAGMFKNYHVFEFKCMKYSRYGDDDIAAFTWCAYDNEVDNEEYSISVPSEVVLDGRSYRVERVLLSTGKKCHGAKKYILPSTIKQICFAGYTHLAEVILNEGIEEISNDAFFKCFDLEKIIIPSTMKKIGAIAFYGCVKLKELYIPSSVTDICEGAALLGLGEETIIKVEKGCPAIESLVAKRLPVRFGNHYEYFDFDPAELNIEYVNSTNYNEE